MHRFVRLLGGSLGAHPGHRPDRLRVPRVRVRPVRWPATCCSCWLVAWFVAGYSVLPHITVEPAHRIIESVSDLSAGEFVAAVIGLTIGLVLGLLLGLPLANFPDPYGWLLPLGVSVVLGLGMMGLTVAKRDDLLDAARDVGLLRTPDAHATGDAEPS